MKALEFRLKHESADLHDPVFLEMLEELEGATYRPKLLSVHRLLYITKKETVSQRTLYYRTQQRTIAYLYDCPHHRLQSVEVFQGNFTDKSFRWLRPRKDETKESAPDEQTVERFCNYLQRVIGGLKDKRDVLTYVTKDRPRERDLCDYFIPLLENIVSTHNNGAPEKNRSVVP